MHLFCILTKSVETRGLSSAGRASALQAEGHRFEPCRSHFGEIAQLARARGSYPRCRGFESPSRYLYRGVAQVVERHVRDVEAASSSLVTPTRGFRENEVLFYYKPCTHSPAGYFVAGWRPIYIQSITSAYM